MELYILDSNYEKLVYIDNAESVLWIKKFNDVGECELYLPADQNHMNIITDGKYIYREEDDMLCEIKAVEIETDVENGDHLIITGYDVKKKLGDRIIRWGVTYSGTVANLIKKLVTDNVIEPIQSQRRIMNLTFNDSNFNELTETINTNEFTGDLLETIKSICKMYNYGFRVKFINDTKTLEFGLFKGVNKASISSDSYVEFSPKYANIISSNYKEDDSNYKNLCYVGYKDSNDVLQLMSVYNTKTEPMGEDRKEVYVDGSSTSRDITEEELLSMFPSATLTTNKYYNNGVIVATVDGDKITVTDSTYLKLIKIVGYNTLTTHNKTQVFNGNIDYSDTYEYKIDYDLGDVVKVANDYGIEAEAVITEIMESDDGEDGYVIEPKFEYTSVSIIEDEEEIVVTGRMLTEYSQSLMTESNEIILLEEATIDPTVASVKISQLPEVDTDLINDQCCLPIVSNNSTQRITYNNLKDKIAQDIGATGGTSYNDLTDKPSIENVELVGNKTFANLGIARIDDIELEALLDWNIEE